ncbi:hypothetical protein B0H17DRAFT_962440, partial [Mycena rosella]
GNLHFPFSTGSIHVASADPSSQPAIDPHYFEEDFDIQVMASVLKFIRKLRGTGGFKGTHSNPRARPKTQCNIPHTDLFASEADPGAAIQTDQEMTGTFVPYLHRTFTDQDRLYKKPRGPEYHTIGSASMLPRAKGGVVSPEFKFNSCQLNFDRITHASKVYGTSNIRVVDLSILPLQISAHPMSMLYGVYVSFH